MGQQGQHHRVCSSWTLLQSRLQTQLVHATYVHSGEGHNIRTHAGSCGTVSRLPCKKHVINVVSRINNSHKLPTFCSEDYRVPIDCFICTSTWIAAPQTTTPQAAVHVKGLGGQRSALSPSMRSTYLFSASLSWVTFILFTASIISRISPSNAVLATLLQAHTIFYCFKLGPIIFLDDLLLFILTQNFLCWFDVQPAFSMASGYRFTVGALIG